MKTRICCFGAILICASLSSLHFGAVFGEANQSGSAKIKMRSGQVVEGEIQGDLVLKVRESESTKGSKKEFTASYIWVRGTDVSTIDEAGVRISKEAFTRLIVASTENLTPDNEVLSNADRLLSGGPFSFVEIANGAVASIYDPFNEERWPHPWSAMVEVVQSMFGGKGAPVAQKAYEQLKLLSQEYKAAADRSGKPVLVLTGKLLGELKDGKVITAFEVDTKKGVTRIPVAEIAGVEQKKLK